MGEILLMLAGALGLYFAYMHLVAPLFVLRQHAFPCEYRFPPADLAATLAEATESFRETCRAFADLGYSPVATSRLDNSNSSTAFVLFRQPADPCIATAMLGRSALGTQVVVEFAQLYRDGSCLSLSNNPYPPLFPRLRIKVAYQLAGTFSLGELLERFRRLRERCGLQDPVKVPEGGELACLERFMNAEAAALRERGLYAAGCENGFRRLTLKGAYVLSWKLLWPWKPLRVWLARRRALAASGSS
jgi:hypothetical protein